MIAGEKKLCSCSVRIPVSPITLSVALAVIPAWMESNIEARRVNGFELFDSWGGIAAGNIADAFRPEGVS